MLLHSSVQVRAESLKAKLCPPRKGGENLKHLLGFSFSPLAPASLPESKPVSSVRRQRLKGAVIGKHFNFQGSQKVSKFHVTRHNICLGYPKRDL